MTAIVATAKPTSNSACLMVSAAAARSVRQGMIVDVKWSSVFESWMAATLIFPTGLVCGAFVNVVC